MAELVAVPLGNGGVIVVEMDHAQAGVVKAGRPGQIVGKAAQTLEAALESVAPAAQSILAKLRPAQPHGITVEFGLTLTAEAGAVIAKATSGCHLKVTLHWERDDDRAG
jgi:NTP-dependent ternary system trypsin peptidase co-occuring protein